MDSMHIVWVVLGVPIVWFWVGCVIDGACDDSGTKRIWSYVFAPLLLLLLLTLIVLVAIPKELRRLGTAIGDWQ